MNIHIENIVKILNALGNNWPLILIVIGVILFLYYRKSIETALKKNSVTTLKVAGTEVIFSPQKDSTLESEATKNVKVLTQEISLKNSDEETAINQENEISEKESGNILHELFKTIVNERAFEKADELYDEWALSETNSDFIIHVYYGYQGLKFDNGDTTASKKILEKIEFQNLDKNKFYGYEILGKSYKKLGALDKAIPFYLKAAELIKDELKKVELYNITAECYYRISCKEEALNLLNSQLNKLNLDGSKVALLKGIAEIYGYEGNFLVKSVILSKALTLTPNDTGILFDVAYSYSKCNLQHSSLLYYKRLITINRNDESAFNNLGVLLDELNLPIISVKNLKKAVELGSNSAVNNLASRYVYAGFTDEANRVIENADKSNDVKGSFTESQANIETSIVEETNREQKYIEISKKIQRYHEKFANGLLNTEHLDTIKTGLWHTKQYRYDVKILYDGNNIELTWYDSQNFEQKITGYFIQGLSGYFTYLEKISDKTMGFSNPLTGKIEERPASNAIKSYDGFFYIDSNEIHFISFNDNDIQKEIIMARL